MEGSTREQQLYGVAACQTDDVLQKKWLSIYPHVFIVIMAKHFFIVISCTVLSIN